MNRLRFATKDLGAGVDEPPRGGSGRYRGRESGACFTRVEAAARGLALSCSVAWVAARAVPPAGAS